MLAVYEVIVHLNNTEKYHVLRTAITERSERELKYLRKSKIKKSRSRERTQSKMLRLYMKFALYTLNRASR